MEPSTTTSVEQLVRSVYRLGLVQRAIARHANRELGSQGFGALAIVHTEGPVRIGEIARRLSIDLSVASRQVAALEAAGHVTREPDPEDGRAQRITTTPEGTRVLRESHRRMVEVFEQALTDWMPEDISALSGGLDRLRDDFAGTEATTNLPLEATR
jgi:DNA-binding MarR family transcriptional regulator